MSLVYNIAILYMYADGGMSDRGPFQFTSAQPTPLSLPTANYIWICVSDTKITEEKKNALLVQQDLVRNSQNIRNFDHI